jgi:hypothetical protein
MNPFSRQPREDGPHRESGARHRLDSTVATRHATACAAAKAAHAAAAAR